MNVIVANEQQGQVAELDIDIIKSITGSYSANELVEMFKNFFYSKMILDVTSIKNYSDIQQYRALSKGLDVEKIIFFIPEGSSICTPNFLAKLVTLGIYNFTTNIDGVRYLLKKSNTYNDVVHIQQMGGGIIEDPIYESSDDDSDGQPRVQQGSLNRCVKIGIRNITEHAGATSLIYMLKRELVTVFGENKVIAIEVNKNDFKFYNDKAMISSTTQELRSVIDKCNGISIILIDLNDFEDNTICDEVLYLLEPSTLKLNKLIRKNRHIFTKIKDKKIILNKSLLTSKDVNELEYEAGVKSFFNLPPLNDRKRNEVITELLAKVGLIQISKENDSSKIFGLFRR